MEKSGLSAIRVDSSRLESRYQEKISARPGLKYGIIEVTTRCQLRCPGCYMVRRQALNKKVMPLKQAIYVLDACREYRQGNDLETMDILGGDPLLWPYLTDYITELLKRGIKPWVFTNMLAITPTLATWLLEREVNITGKLNIDPSDESQIDQQAIMIGRSVRMARKMIGAIKVLTDAGYKAPLLRLQNLIRKSNIDLIPGYYRWCLEHNIGTDLELMGSGEPIDYKYWAIAPTPRQVAELVPKIQAVRREFGLDPAEVLMPHLFGSCPFYDAGLYFDVQGGIRACSNSTVSLGSISDPDAIKKAYESELICNRLRLSQELVGEPCSHCAKWSQCRGGCRATVEGSGDPYGGYSLCPVPYL